MLLSETQQKAVEYPNKPLFVWAGPGTGKTTILIERLFRLSTTEGIKRHQILVLVVTNKSCFEIKRKISERFNFSNVPRRISTFHSFCKFLLEKEIDSWSRGSYHEIRIVDEDMQAYRLKHVLEKINIFPIRGRYSDNWACKAINRLKIKPYYTKDKELLNEVAKECGISTKNLQRLHDAYQQELFSMSIDGSIYLDFADLCIKALQLLEKREIQAKWRNSIKAVLIDEFQDLNDLQLEIIKRLIGKNGNISCFGDPNQSIYGFIKGTQKTCYKFIEHFSAELVYLDKNYRSTPEIVELSDQIIKLNKDDSEYYKNLKSDKEPRGEKIQCFCFSDVPIQIEFIRRKIINLQEEDNTLSLRDIAILYRYHSSSPLISKTLNKHRIPYQTEDKNKTRIIRFIIVFLETIYFYSKEGIPLKQNIQIISSELNLNISPIFLQYMNVYGYSFLTALDRIHQCEGCDKYDEEILLKFKNLILRFEEIKKTCSLERIVKEILKVTKYEEVLWQQSREGEMKSLERFIRSYEDYIDEEIVRDIVNRFNDTENYDALFLGTIHKAKGLEFRYVFLVDAERLDENIHDSKENSIETQEERRVLYVALTRAQEAFYVTCSTKKKKTYIPLIFQKEQSILGDKVEYIKFQNTSEGVIKTDKNHLC